MPRSSAAAVGLQPLKRHINESRSDAGVELGSGAPANLGEREELRPPPLVGTHGSDRVPCVHDRDDAGLDGDLGACESIRVPGPIPPLMVGADDVDDVAKGWVVSEHASACGATPRF